jgi:excisionase family DNA binding protein
MFMTIYQVAEQLQCSTRTIERHVQAGRLPAHNIGTGKHLDLRFTEGELLAFLKRQQVPVVKYSQRQSRKIKPAVDYLT